MGGCQLCVAQASVRVTVSKWYVTLSGDTKDVEGERRKRETKTSQASQDTTKYPNLADGALPTPENDHILGEDNEKTKVAFALGPSVAEALFRGVFALFKTAAKEG